MSDEEAAELETTRALGWSLALSRLAWAIGWCGLFAMVAFVFRGCTATYPTPELAVKACVEAGGDPVYTSALNGTKFSCENVGE